MPADGLRLVLTTGDARPWLGQRIWPKSRENLSVRSARLAHLKRPVCGAFGMVYRTFGVAPNRIERIFSRVRKNGTGVYAPRLRLSAIAAV